jgi:hypothetical protein
MQFNIKLDDPLIIYGEIVESKADSCIKVLSTKLHGGNGENHSKPRGWLFSGRDSNRVPIRKQQGSIPGGGW